MNLRKCILTLLLFCCSVFLFSGSSLASQDQAQKSGLSLGEAVVLGVVEGLTEYLPVSSTGHLLLAERILGIGEPNGAPAEESWRVKEASDAYTICIQAGAIIAVLGLYFRRVKQMLLGLIGKDKDGARLLINVIAGFLPAAVIGLLFNKLIKSVLFGVWPVVIAWFVGGLAILLVSCFNRNRENSKGGLALAELSWKMALIVGFAQCVAMWPGVSRSLATIVGGLLVGLSLSAAVEFSFLLGLITLGAATAYDTLKHGQLMLEMFDAMSLAVGVVFAFLAAIISVKWMVGYLNRHGLAVFGYYRVALALIVGGLLFAGVM